MRVRRHAKRPDGTHQPFSVHAEGERVILTSAEGRQEIDLLPPAASVPESLPMPLVPQGIVSVDGEGFEDPPLPGESPLDEALADLADGDVLPKGGGS